jgi:lysophospholipase L1-like esterase
MAAELGAGFRVIEEGLNGRTTVRDEPGVHGRNGLAMLVPCIQTHDPVDLLIIMLGTNDTKPIYSASAAEISNGLKALVKAALNPFNTERRRAPAILIASPPLIGDDIVDSWLYGVFDESSAAKSAELLARFKLVADEFGCHFIDVAAIARAAPGESVHLAEDGHAAIGRAMAQKARGILAG